MLLQLTVADKIVPVSFALNAKPYNASAYNTSVACNKKKQNGVHAFDTYEFLSGAQHIWLKNYLTMR